MPRRARCAFSAPSTLLTPCVAWIAEVDAIGADPAATVSKLTVRTVAVVGDVVVAAAEAAVVSTAGVMVAAVGDVVPLTGLVGETLTGCR